MFSHAVANLSFHCNQQRVDSISGKSDHQTVDHTLSFFQLISMVASYFYEYIISLFILMFCIL
jgi:hypothetical protein